MFVYKSVRVFCLILTLYSSTLILISASLYLDGTEEALERQEASSGPQLSPPDEDGQSRSGLFSGIRDLWSKPMLGLLPRVKLTSQVQISKTTKVPGSAQPVVVSAKPTERQAVAPSKQYTRDQLDSALDLAGLKCGQVPLFEKTVHKSINETLTKEEMEEDRGDFRIINGIDSTPGEWPWIVRITECPQLDEEACFTCTGTLLNNRWIISAGHCGYNRSGVNYFNATFGLYDMVSPDKSAFTTTIDKIVVHPDYNNLDNDLALFRLTAPISFSEFVQPACLIRPTRNVLQYTRAKRCYAVGYGLTAGMVAAVKLQKLQIKPKPPSECNSDTLGYVQLRSNTICIGVLDGQTGATCKGDSGGPDLCYDVKLNRWELFGTVSYGPADCDRDTGEKWLTVSVDLSNYRTWILSTVLANS